MFTVELSPYIAESNHTPDSFLVTCTTHILEKLHKKELNHESSFCVESVLGFLYKFNIH